MSLVDVNEQVSLLECLAKQPLEGFEELGAFVSIRFVQQLVGFFPRQPQLLECLANGFTATLDSEVNCSPTPPTASVSTTDFIIRSSCVRK